METDEGQQEIHTRHNSFEGFDYYQRPRIVLDDTTISLKNIKKELQDALYAIVEKWEDKQIDSLGKSFDFKAIERWANYTLDESIKHLAMAAAIATASEKKSVNKKHMEVAINGHEMYAKHMFKNLKE